MRLEPSCRLCRSVIRLLTQLRGAARSHIAPEWQLAMVTSSTEVVLLRTKQIPLAAEPTVSSAGLWPLTYRTTPAADLLILEALPSISRMEVASWP